MKAILFAAALAACATTAAAAPSTIRIAGAWSRPAAAGMNGAGYLTVTNTGKAPAVLTGAESPLARKIELHQTSMTGGVMRMTRQDKGVPIPPGGSALFSPGGDHLMIFGLKKAMKSGDRLPVTLIFADGKRMPVTLRVGADGPGAQAHH